MRVVGFVARTQKLIYQVVQMPGDEVQHTSFEVISEMSTRSNGTAQEDKPYMQKV